MVTAAVVPDSGCVSVGRVAVCWGGSSTATPVSRQNAAAHSKEVFTVSAFVQAESEETKERLFESMLSECRDAIQAVREELKPDQVGPSARPPAPALC